jgi:phosphopantothenoylcysteine decarboxylase/phosphopantothenate--cysteine ligase
MGLEIARAAQQRGATVTVVCGPTYLQPPAGVSFVPVVSAEEMLAAVEERFAGCDVFVATAAVSDYRPQTRERGKLKKKKERMTLLLVRNADILQRMGRKRQDGQLIVGFSLEVKNALDYAREKLARKNCDVMVVTTPANFGDSREAVRVISGGGVIAEVPPSTKPELAQYLCGLIGKLRAGRRPALIARFPLKARAAKSRRVDAGGGDS